MTRLTLCELGLMPHKWHRVSGYSRDGSLRCAKCHKTHDSEFIDGTNCPRCGSPMRPPRVTHRECTVCGVTA